MIILKLDPETLEETGELYGDYDSLAWNEKWQSYGDCQIRSYDIGGALRFFELDTFIAIPTSHVVMRVEKVDLELSESGTQMVTVSGKGVEAIFEHRPGLWSIVATTDDFRKDHEFGDDLETTPEYFLDPQTIASKIYQRTNEESYGHPARLGYLKLPFRDHLDQKFPEGQFTGERIPYYKFGSDSVWTAFDELMELGQFHITVARPGSPYHSRLKTPADGDKPILTSYLPKRALSDGVKGSKVDMSLSAIRNDYIACKQGASADSPNIKFRSHEDGVMETWANDGAQKPSGLKARVGYEEVSIEKLDEYNFRREETVYFLMPFAKALQDGRTFSLTTDGVFPMDPKDFSPIDEPGKYYLGDIVTIEFPWGDTVDVRVVEFVRTYDSGGQKEYPTFEPVLYTNKDLSKSIGDPEPVHYMSERIRDNVIAELKEGIYSDDLLEAFKNYKMHPDWL